MIKKCLTCNKEFYTKPSLIKRGNGKYCSRECSKISRSGKNNYRWRGGSIKKICKLCGKEFLATCTQIKNGNGVFCSHRCWGIWKSKNIRGKNHPHWKGGKAKKICLICGKDFYIWFIKSNAKFCSKKCYGQWRSKNITGEKSPNWKGSKCITPITIKIRHSDKYKIWRQNIFIRDNFTCQECGQIGGKLDVHHIKTFHKLIKEIKKYLPLLDLYEGAMLYTPLWDISNGITLCEKCHSRKKRGKY